MLILRAQVLFFKIGFAKGHFEEKKPRLIVALV